MGQEVSLKELSIYKSITKEKYIQGGCLPSCLRPLRFAPLREQLLAFRAFVPPLMTLHNLNAQQFLSLVAKPSPNR